MNWVKHWILSEKLWLFLYFLVSCRLTTSSECLKKKKSLNKCLSVFACLLFWFIGCMIWLHWWWLGNLLFFRPSLTPPLPPASLPSSSLFPTSRSLNCLLHPVSCMIKRPLGPSTWFSLICSSKWSVAATETTHNQRQQACTPGAPVSGVILSVRS